MNEILNLGFNLKQMKNILYIGFSLILFSCGKIAPKGEIAIKEMQVSDFQEINGSGKFRMFWINAPQNKIEVETYPNIFENLDIKVKNGTLILKEKRETKNVGFYDITVYGKYNPSRISVSDSVEINISGEIKTDQFQLNLKNNGKFIGAVRSRKAEVSMENTSLANFKGFTENVEIKIKDTANLLAPYWMINNLKIESKNGNYAEVNVKDSLKGTIDDTAKFLYYNNPVRAFKIGKNANVENKKLE